MPNIVKLVWTSLYIAVSFLPGLAGPIHFSSNKQHIVAYEELKEHPDQTGGATIRLT